MARHLVSEPRVQAAIEGLAALFLRLGSINAVAEALSGQLDGSRIYPNRVHGLLSGDPGRSVNTATLEAIESALDGTEDAGDPAAASKRLTQIAQAVAAELTHVSDVGDAARRVAEELELPFAVVSAAVDSALLQQPHQTVAVTMSPDWSWQDDAVERSLAALRKGPARKAGLVIPTGGGKTRISLRIILRWLAESERKDSVVLWVTHRTRLRLQARRALQQLLGASGQVPDGAASLFADRVKFVMVSELPREITKHGERIALTVVDEAHHAAAASYRPIFNDVIAPGLLLTATPNRADDLPIGIDEIAYTLPYRDLIERGCVVEPLFEPPLDLRNLNWSVPHGLRDLADYLLDRTAQDFRKALVAVSTRARAEVLHAAITDLLDDRPHHPLSGDDVAFVHGAATSGPGTPADYLDEFTARPRGILVATGQLVGEGFDDPLIDAAVVTYPSASMSHLMQVAGRALRYAPGKRVAHVVQVRESPLEYHFEHRWLYQDISDALRPDLVDLHYHSPEDLRAQVSDLLDRHAVSAPIRARIAAQLDGVEHGHDVRLMLTGIPYFGRQEQFDQQARWGAILVSPDERDRFTTVYNDVSARRHDIKENHGYLAAFVKPDHRPGSLSKSYVDLIEAMEYARRELDGTPYAGAADRNHKPNRGSSWLRYVTFSFEPMVPEALDHFLADAVNRDELVARYLERDDEWAAAVRLELPLAGSEAFLLSESEAAWLLSARRTLIDRLRDASPLESFAAVAAWRSGLEATPIPLRLADEIDQLLRGPRFEDQYLTLAAANG